MKKIILIISAALLALGILGCAVTALPVVTQGEKYMNDKLEQGMETFTYTFEDSKDNYESVQDNKYVGIDMNILSAKAVFSYNNDGKTIVRYTTPDKNKKLECRIDKCELIIHETQESFLFPMPTFNLVPAKIEISLPERYRCSNKLDYAKLFVTSGSVTGDMPSAIKSEITLASGSVNATAQTGELTLDVASGNVEITSRYARNSVMTDSLNVDCKSGQILLKDFSASRNEFRVSSGKVEATGITGDIRSDVKSGSLSLYCTENVGEAELDMSSGTTYMALSKISSAKIDYSVSSGSVDVRIGENSETLTKTGTVKYYSEAAEDGYDTYIKTSVASGKCVIEEINR